MRVCLLSLSVVLAVMTANAQRPDDVRFETSDDKFSLSIAGFNIGLGNNDEHDLSEDTVTYRENDCPGGVHTGTCVTKEKQSLMHFDLLGPFSFGWGNWIGSDYYGNWAEQGDFLRTKNVFAFSMGFCNIDVSINRGRSVFWTFGTKWTVTSYRFMNHMLLADNADGVLMPLIDPERPTSMLRTSYIGFPMGLSYRNGPVRIMATISAEFLTNSWTRYAKKDDRNSISGVNTFRSTAELIVGWGGLGAFVNYGITPLFQKGVGNDAHLITAGFLICL